MRRREESNSHEYAKGVAVVIKEIKKETLSGDLQGNRNEHPHQYIAPFHLVEEVAAGLHFEPVGFVHGALEHRGAHFRRLGLSVPR